MEYDEGYAYYEDDDDFEDEDVDDEESYAQEWLDQVRLGVEKLERRKSRRLTNRELEGILEGVLEQNDPYPDTDKAFQDYYAESGQKEYDLDSSQGRQEYMADRLTDIERDQEEEAQEEAQEEAA